MPDQKFVDENPDAFLPLNKHWFTAKEYGSPVKEPVSASGEPRALPPVPASAWTRTPGNAGPTAGKAEPPDLATGLANTLETRVQYIEGHLIDALKSLRAAEHCIYDSTATPAADSKKALEKLNPRIRHLLQYVETSGHLNLALEHWQQRIATAQASLQARESASARFMREMTQPLPAPDPGSPNRGSQATIPGPGSASQASRTTNPGPRFPSTLPRAGSLL